MEKVFNSKSFWVVFIVAAAAIFVLDINMSRTYKSETDIMVIPKSVVAVKNSNQIIENLSALPGTLSFYARMTQSDTDVANAAVAELPDYKKKAYWDTQVRVERVGASGILKIITTDKESSQAELLNSEAVETLIGSVGLYYDIKNDVDVRIVDPAITNYSSYNFNYIIFTESLMGSFAVIFVIFYLALNLFQEEMSLKITRPNFLAQYKKNSVHAQIEQAEKMVDELPVEKSETDAIPEDAKKEWSLPVEETPYTDLISMNKVASAPANLPIAEEEVALPVQPELSIARPDSITEMPEETTVLEKKVTLPEKNQVPQTHEATAEEVKERLNKLLSGKL